MFLGLVAGMLLASKLPMMRTVFDSATKESVALLSGALIIVLLGLQVFVQWRANRVKENA